MRDLLVTDFIKEANKELAKLVGHNPVKECPVGGCAKLVGDALVKFCDSFYDYLLEVQTWRIGVYVSEYDEYIPFAQINLTYKPDKRRTTGKSDIIESVELVLSRELPDDLDMMDLSQIVAYDESKADFDRLYAEQMELMKQYKANIEHLKKLQSNMRSEAYSNEKGREAEKYWNKVYEL